MVEPLIKYDNLLESKRLAQQFSIAKTVGSTSNHHKGSLTEILACARDNGLLISNIVLPHSTD